MKSIKFKQIKRQSAKIIWRLAGMLYPTYHHYCTTPLPPLLHYWPLPPLLHYWPLPPLLHYTDYPGHYCITPLPPLPALSYCITPPTYHHYCITPALTTIPSPYHHYCITPLPPILHYPLTITTALPPYLHYCVTHTTLLHHSASYAVRSKGNAVAVRMVRG